ncbi:MAG: hypothetical protein HY549_01580 [Elusimicrobia bacterium]|nr:hypothetical protein [Elusimicrobiota bacterium]
MNTSSQKRADDKPGLGPGIMELRHIASKIYGIRVQRYLVTKLKNVQELSRANSRSDLFCIQVDGMNDSEEGALKRFKEIVAKAGLGAYFGVRNER